MTDTGRGKFCLGGAWLVITALLIAPLVPACVGEIQMADRPDRPSCPEVPCEPGEVCQNGTCVPDQLVDAALDTANGPPQILVRPTVLNYVNPTVGGEMAGTVTITNIGGTPLTIRDLNLEDFSPGHDFHMTAPPRPFTIDPGDTNAVPVVVTLRLTDASIPSGVLHVSSNDPQTSHVPVQLTASLLGDAMLDICVLLGDVIADGCNENPADLTPFVEFKDVPLTQTVTQDVSLTAIGFTGMIDRVDQVRLVSSMPIDDYALELYVRDAGGVETPAALPFDLVVGDTMPPATELRVRVSFTANRGGLISGVSLSIDTFNNSISATSTIPIIGNVTGCGSGDTQSDPENCGYCGHRCLNDHGTTACELGICVPTCEDGWDNCDGVLDNGCEASLDLLGNCGGCGNTCAIANTEVSCMGRACVMTGCDPGFANCNGNPADGCEGVGTPANCCGHVCVNDHGTAQCVDGACAPTCGVGWGDCDGDPDNGCEAAVTPTDCCGHTCVNPHGTTSCEARVCKPVCAPGYGDCDGNPDNGCEVDVSTSDCCGKQCVNGHGTTSCQGGVCVPVCDAGWGNCDGNPDNGCETAVTDASCCGRVCVNPHGTTSCQGGVCVPVCDAGWGNCDGNDANGCEASATPADCCGVACTNPHGGVACVNLHCAPTCAPGFFDCDGNPNNGCEAAASSADCCGHVCTNAHGTTGCQGGACVPTCAAGWYDCDGNPDNGCEGAATTGSCCGKLCTNAHGTTACANGVCLPVCAAGWYDCDRNPDNGCEGAATVADCCTHVCTNANGTTACTNGVCAPTCAAGYGDCDGNPDNGCEAAVTTADCCGIMCVNSHGTTACQGGICVPVCDADYYDCDRNPANGCEGGATVANCCGKTCTNAHGTTACTGGTCVPACAAGWADCDGDPSNGCETSLATIANCGACGVACAPPHATGSCATGTCTITACDAGWGNCNGQVNDGCETDITVTAAHCGGCGQACSTNHVPTPVCTAGVCTGACATGWSDCDGNKLTNGCETDPATSAANCGGCGRVCSNNNIATPTCAGGNCTGACNAGWGDCNGDKRTDGCETNILTTPTACGACGQSCSSNHITTPSCAAGSCNGTCDAGWGDCNGNKLSDGCETNIQTTAAHCGGCGQACSGNNIPTPTCTAGSCTGACAAGFDDCNANKRTDGCEINLNTNAANCGGCGQGCSNNNIATPTCSAGTCNGTCNAGYGDCNANKRTDGCEINTTITPAHCGGCGQNCSNTNIATPTCAAGICNGACNSGWGDCNGNKLSDGCETNILTTPTACGACGQICSGNNIPTPTCSGGTCNGTCAANFADCNGNKLSDGCEANLLTDAAHCGGCSTNCNSPLPPNTASASCSGGSCQITGCSGAYYNQDGLYSTGCECLTDGVGNTCASATALPAVAVDGSQSVAIYNLAGPGPDQDWFSVTFTSGATCNWGPRIMLASPTATVYMKVYTSCALGTWTCNVEGGNSGSGNYRDWQENHQATCVRYGAVDPTPDYVGTFIQGTTWTAYIQVYTTASQTSCMPYTLTITN